MLTEEDKYVLIQNYLKGRLSGDSLAEFESKMKLDGSFTNEVDMHRIANEAVMDFYLLQVKDSVKKVVKQKSNQNQRTKWGLGLAVIALSTSLLYTFYPADKISGPSSKTVEEVSASKEREKMIKPIERREVLASRSPSFVTNKKVENTKVETTLEETVKPIVRENTAALVIARTSEQETIFLDHEKEEMVPKQETMPSIVPAPILDATETKKSDITPQSRPKSVDLVFNPLIGEEASFPMDETYNGELLIFDVNGTVVFRSAVQNGYPNRWDGRLNTGGSAVSGQYGFVMKDLAGKEVMQGFITVAR